NVWTGDSSDSWTEAGNWEEAYVPGKSVLIQSGSNNYPLIEDDITVNNLTIEAGAVLTQMDGIITVKGDFDLLSSEVTNASYLPKGGSLTVTGKTRVHQYISDEKGLVSYSMSSSTDYTDNSNIGTSYKIQYYENPKDSWTILNTTMQPGIGYSIYSLNNLVFSGNINRTPIEVPLIRTNGKGYGWNLLGNPYTASINWAALVDTTKIENSYWLWHPGSGTYGAYNENAGVGTGPKGVIPSHHAFFVKLKTTHSAGSFIFSPSATVANTENYLKSSSYNKPSHIKISADNTKVSDYVAIAFVQDASVGLDKFDTEKFFGNGYKSNPFQIFTVEGSMKLSINSLPDTGEETTVKLGYRSTEIGSYTIHLKEYHSEHSEVLLTDTKEKTTVDLLNVGAYTFSVDRKETNTTRFTLTFPANIPTSAEKIVSTDNTNIYLKDGDVIVDVRGEAESLTYDMVGVSGNRVARGNLFPGVNNLGKFSSGLYIINTRNEEGTIVSKKLLVTH
ncbi:MAG TPA: hypothetical protein GX731_09525, partial [Clostridiales bacterium]|nr:hypothetical protein [Clostridiales bacterium]